MVEDDSLPVRLTDLELRMKALSAGWRHRTRALYAAPEVVLESRQADAGQHCGSAVRQWRATWGYRQLAVSSTPRRAAMNTNLT